MSVVPGPAYIPLSIWQGQTFGNGFQFNDYLGTPIDLTGYTAQLMLRNDTEDPLPLVTWGSATGELVMGGIAGTIMFNLDGAQTQALPTGNEVQTWLYDLLITNSTVSPPYSQRVVIGQLTVFPAVTRPPVPTQGRPSAGFTFTPSGLAVTFTDTSTDSFGTLQSVLFAFGDGSFASTTPNGSVTHTYGAAGTYAVSQAVVDSAATPATSAQLVTVA
jgi:PKD repeat protein